MATAQPMDKEPTSRTRVLLVDDNADGRRALAKVLQAKGYEVTERPDGQSALDALRDGPPPDYVLTDLILPDIDGREVAQAAHALNPRPFVALITGWDIEPEVEDPERWGVDHVFLKPLRILDLLAKLEEHPAGTAPTGSPGSGPAEPPTPAE